MFDGVRCVCGGGSQGLRGICHLFVLTGPNLFIETAHLFSYPHSKLMKHN